MLEWGGNGVSREWTRQVCETSAERAMELNTRGPLEGHVCG